MQLRTLILSMVVVAIPNVSSGALQGTQIDLTSPVQKESRITYLDLLRKLMPDAKADATANSTIPFRSITEPGRDERISGPIKFDIAPYWFNSEGKQLLMLRVDLTADDANGGTPYQGEAVVLAVFKLEPTATLLDALEIKTDRFTGFWEDRSLFRLDSKNDAFIVSSSHWNAGENYTSLDILFLDEGRIKSIASQFIFETQGCGATFNQKPSFRAIAGSDKKYPDVLVTVKLSKKPDEASCPRRTRGYTRQYQGVYRWNPVRRRYEGRSRQLEALSRFNKMRVSSP
jgi:hypothetical protein